MVCWKPRPLRRILLRRRLLLYMGGHPVGFCTGDLLSWFGLFLITGLIESWFLFKKAMTGQKARRGLPYGFACLCPMLSLLALYFVRKLPAKSPEEQEVLVKRWQEMSATEKFVKWIEWGFRRGDPTESVLTSAAAAADTNNNGPAIPGQQSQWIPPQGPPGIPPAPGQCLQRAPPQPMGQIPMQGYYYNPQQMPPQGAPRMPPMPVSLQIGPSPSPPVQQEAPQQPMAQFPPQNTDSPAPTTAREVPSDNVVSPVQGAQSALPGQVVSPSTGTDNRAAERQQQ